MNQQITAIPPVITLTGEQATAAVREVQVSLGAILIGAREVAGRIGLSPTEAGARTVREMCASGRITAQQIGTAYAFHWPSVVAKLFPQPKK